MVSLLLDLPRAFSVGRIGVGVRGQDEWCVLDAGRLVVVDRSGPCMQLHSVPVRGVGIHANLYSSLELKHA